MAAIQTERRGFVPRETLGQGAIELLEVSADSIAPALDRLAQEDRIRTDMLPLNNNPSEKSQQAVGEAAGFANAASSGRIHSDRMAQ